jgi:MFS family permease
LVGTVLWPALSDEWGRKPLMVVGAFVSACCLWLLPDLTHPGWAMPVAVLLIAFMNAGVMAEQWGIAQVLSLSLGASVLGLVFILLAVKEPVARH